MQIIERCDLLWEALNDTKIKGGKIHLIPTMGALHEGHISLVNHTLNKGALVVVSLFVNPSQFNESKDLSNYPRTFEADKEKLELAGCNILFFPSEDEIYPKRVDPEYHLDGLDTKMEGRFRPGHFQGVVQVVDRLFSIVKPDSAFFGQKDFQQLFIVRHMMTKLGHRTNVIGSPTIREVSGLAMSSRNTLLSVKARSNSSIIFRVLKQVQIEYINGLEIDQIITSGSNIINHTEGFELEYLEIVDPTRLTDIQKNENKSAIACIAAHVEGVRLIDNLTLIA
jgi:pantoate--beta-alanine ligase